MKVNKGDILVCASGFKNTDSGGTGDDGGSGYVEGMMIASDVDSITDNPSYVFWKFQGGRGVYQRALRLATEEEIRAFKDDGIRNVKDIKRKIMFVISYEALDGEYKKTEVEAYYETAAVSSIKDLKRVNYVMAG